MATIRRRVKDQERQTGKDLGGKRQPGSGAFWTAKGDVSTPRYLVECKLTDKASYSLKEDLLRKIAKEAAVVGKEPVFQIEFQGTGRTDSYAVIPWWMFLALTTGGAES